MPIDAVTGLLGLFDRYQGVMLGHAHPCVQDANGLISLITHPAFSGSVNDFVMEAGTSRHQELMDAYIRGEDVPRPELKKAWQDTTIPLAWDSPIYESIYRTVREVNQQRDSQVRVLLGDPAIDWSAVQTREDWISYIAQRDATFASIADEQSLSKGRRVLIFAGAGHLLRWPSPLPSPDTTMILDDKYPGQIVTLFPHVSLWTNDVDVTLAVEERLAPWPVSSIAAVKGTWLGALEAYGLGPTNGSPVPPLEQQFDYYWYRGPRASLDVWHPYPATYQDQDYWQEIQRRYRIVNDQDLDPYGQEFTWYGRLFGAVQSYLSRSL